MAEIKVRYSRTINMGNYESIQISVEYGRELKPKEDVEKAIDAEFEMVENKVLDLAEELTKDG